ncbi:Heterokaryon incompatibility protein 6- OR allele, partial [Apiospora sp. TS-2023a]
VEDMEVDEDNADFYRPLNIDEAEFRLLLVQAGEGDEAVKCQLLHASLKDGADRPPYETVSYCWGDPAETGAIFVDGLEMVVPLSAAAVLKRMRKPTEDRTLWIDAICINQDDVDERGRQVALMRKIYCNTVQNLIWLGEGVEEATGYCLAVLDSIYRHAKSVTNDFATSLDEITCKTLPSGSISGLGGSLLEHHLITFFSSPWFERVWVIQEALLAPRSLVHAYSYELDFEKLLLGATCLSQLPHSTNFHCLDNHIGLMNCQKMYDLSRKTKEAGKSLDAILDKLVTFKCTDPRDYVYGILGLYQNIAGLEGTLPALLTPDYTKPVAAVMRDASRYIIDQSPNLDFFRLLRHRTESTYEQTGVPSWAEPWHLRRPNQESVAKEMKHTLYSADNAVGKREHAITAATLSYDPDVLVLTGVIADKVKSTSCVINSEDPMQFAELLGTSDSPIHLWAIQVDPETLGLALIAEATAASERPTAEYARISALTWADFIAHQKERPRDVEKNLGGSKKNPYTQPRFEDEKAEFTEEEWSALVEYDEAVHCATHDRRIFQTEAGRIGLGPKDMVEGDVVAVLYGCRWPVILRPRGRRGCGWIRVYRGLLCAWAHGRGGGAEACGQRR